MFVQEVGNSSPLIIKLGVACESVEGIIQDRMRQTQMIEYFKSFQYSICCYKCFALEAHIHILFMSDSQYRES